jgi:hypothetical protein
MIQLSAVALTEAASTVNAGAWWASVDHWGNRYQTLLAAMIALAAAIPVLMQLKELRGHSAAAAAERNRAIAQEYRNVLEKIDDKYNAISGYHLLSDLQAVRETINVGSLEDLTEAIRDYQREVIRGVAILQGSAAVGDAAAESNGLAADALLRLAEAHPRGSDQAARRIAADVAVQALRASVTELTRVLALGHAAALAHDLNDNDRFILQPRAASASADRPSQVASGPPTR